MDLSNDITVLIEAMSRGCYCAGSKTAGIPELLEPNYVFNKGSVKGIVEILESITEVKLMEQAVRNFEEAKKYDADLLIERRREFIMKFKKQ